MGSCSLRHVRWEGPLQLGMQLHVCLADSRPATRRCTAATVQLRCRGRFGEAKFPCQIALVLELCSLLCSWIVCLLFPVQSDLDPVDLQIDSICYAVHEYPLACRLTRLPSTGIPFLTAMSSSNRRNTRKQQITTADRCQEATST